MGEENYGGAFTGSQIDEAVNKILNEDFTGPSGPDGNPIGTVISFMGTTAPKDYLVCDGETYNVSDYPDLASFFEDQFGEANHFGGDGTTTFAVPDMRNLFLRGYRGEAEEQLSGQVGNRQEATEVMSIFTYSNGHFDFPSSQDVHYPDKRIYDPADKVFTQSGANEYVNTDFRNHPRNSIRPVNMAVLFCIKAVESESAEATQETYDDQERVIGTWFGKPLYGKGYIVSGSTYPTQSYIIFDNDTSKIPVSLTGELDFENGSSYIIPFTRVLDNGGVLSFVIHKAKEGELTYFTKWTEEHSFVAKFYLKYTKNTD